MSDRTGLQAGPGLQKFQDPDWTLTGDIAQSKVTKEGVEKLKKALPNAPPRLCVFRRSKTKRPKS